MSDPEYISTIKAAELLGLTRQHVLRLVKAGDLEGIKLSPRSWAVSAASVEALRQARLKASDEKPGKSEP